MSGGDLDGDVYTCCWDQTICENVKEEEPQKYSKPKFEQTELDSNARLEDLFTFYLENDNLGRICNLMMKIADFKGKQGPRNKVVTELSKLASIAVDFAKHGLCVPQHLIEKL